MNKTKILNLIINVQETYDHVPIFVNGENNIVTRVSHAGLKNDIANLL